MCVKFCFLIKLHPTPIPFKYQILDSTLFTYIHILCFCRLLYFNFFIFILRDEIKSGVLVFIILQSRSYTSGILEVLTPFEIFLIYRFQIFL